MKRIRLLVVAVMAAASVGALASPASARPCPEEANCPPCTTQPVDTLVYKLTGKDLFMCPG